MICICDILGFTLWDRTRNEDLLKEADEQPIEIKMKEMRLRWFVHLQRMPDAEADSEVQTEGEEEKARRYPTALGGPQQP